MTSKKESTESENIPAASRPYIPGYGVPKGKKGMLAWSHVSERMTNARHYWVTTANTEGQPHAMPVDGLWIGDKLYFGGSLQTRRSRDLGANPAVCVHLESADDVVMLQGEAHPLREVDSALAAKLVEASALKYGHTPKPEDFIMGGTFVFRPQVVFAWSQFLKDATRWHFPSED